jgi:transcriptional regulator with XRE-family HTH domain
VRAVGRPTLDPVRAERVRQVLLRLCRERFRENVTALAAALGRSQPAISHLLTGVNAPSYETVERIGGLVGMTATELLDKDDAVSLRDHPHLEEAITSAMAQGWASADSIQQVRAASRHIKRDLDRLTWLNLLLGVEDAQPAGPEETAPTPSEARPLRIARKR